MRNNGKQSRETEGNKGQQSWRLFPYFVASLKLVISRDKRSGKQRKQEIRKIKNIELFM
ncbi:MAG: hypothetical protein ACRC30_11585 [Clostridium sp.]